MAETSKSKRKKFHAFSVIVAVTLLFAAEALREDLFSRYENKSWDWRLGLIADRDKADKAIKIIMVDQFSLDYFSEQDLTWPWPRSMYVPVLRFLKRAGARAAAFDIVFSESSAHHLSEDQELGSAMGNSVPVVNLAAFQSRKAVISDEKISALRSKAGVNSQGVSSAERFFKGATLPRFNYAVLPVPEISDNSAILASGRVEPDEDGLFRRYSLGGYVRDVPVLSMPFALYEISLKPDEKRVTNEELKPYVDQEGNLMLRFHGPHGTYETTSIKDVIYSEIVLAGEGEQGALPLIKPETFRDAFVFIGVWAPGLLDLRAMPLDPVYRGVEYHATALDNLLHLDFLRKVGWWWSFAFSAIFVVAAGSVTFLMHQMWRQFICHTIAFGALVLIACFSAFQGYWLPMVIPIVSALAAGLASLIVVYNIEGKGRRFLRSAFAHYVTASVINRLIDDPSALSLGGERREISILFSDLQGFSALSESMDPANLVRLLNKYLTAMTDIIMESGGTLDKYQGDAVIAFWNAPLAVPDHAFRAVKAALDCQECLKSLAGEFQVEFGVSLHMRIGINTGMVSVGNFGSRDRFDYTVIGDNANLTSRLEGVNKVFGTSILVSKAAAEGAGNKIAFRKVADVRVVGRKEVVTVLEPLGMAGSTNVKSADESFSKALKYFESAELSEALREFEALRDDPVSKSYVKRLEKEFSNAGGRDWSPVWNLTEK